MIRIAGGSDPRDFLSEKRVQLRLKVEFFHGRDWSGWRAEEFIAELSSYIRWYREGRLKAFREGGRTVYDTIRGRRERLGLAA
ncbi:hypothetical protein I7648_04705 [Collinsella tanakaei]|nr:hypothetical protein [Collinsella tanakaei]